MAFLKPKYAGYEPLENGEGSYTSSFPAGTRNGFPDVPTVNNPAELVELRSRGGLSRAQNSSHWTTTADSTLIDRPIQKGETLQKVALLYGISVGELKRVNNLMSEQEFYGLSWLKIPVSNYSKLLQEAGEASSSAPSLVALGGDDSSEVFLPLSDTEPGWDDEHRHHKLSTSLESVCSSNDDQKKFEKMLKNVDESLEKAKSLTATLQSSQPEDAFNASSAPPPTRYHNLVLERTIRNYLLALLVVSIILVPVGFIIYEAIISNEK